MVDKLVRELAWFSYRAAVNAAFTGHSENMGYFLDDAAFFAAGSRNEEILKQIADNRNRLRELALRQEIKFCLDRAEEMIYGREPDRMMDSKPVRKELVVSLVSDAYDLGMLVLEPSKS